MLFKYVSSSDSKILSIDARCKSRKIRESLEFKRLKCDRSKTNINRGDGNLMKTNKFTPFPRNIKDLESALRNQINHYKGDVSSNKFL